MSISPKSLAPASMALGAAIAIVSGVLTLFSPAVLDGRSNDFSTLVVGGTLLFLVGLFRYFLTPRVTDPFKDAPTDFKALLRGMAGAAEYTGQFSPDKIELIKSILEKVYRKTYDQTLVQNACRALMGEEEDLRKHLFDWHAQLPMEFRRLIVQASALVIGSERHIDQDSEEFLLHISRALRLPDEEFANNVSKRNELLDGTQQVAPA